MGLMLSAIEDAQNVLATIARCGALQASLRLPGTTLMNALDYLSL
jgi:hypothetical protein